MNKLISILIKDHSTYFKRLWDAEILERALKTVSQEIVLDKRISRTGVETDLTVKDRLVELGQEKIILSARVNAYKEELTNTSEGKKALSDWYNGKGE